MESQEIAKRLFLAVDELKPELIGTLQKLVRIPSVVGEEANAQEFMAVLYRELGLNVDHSLPDMEALRAHPAFIDTGEPYENRPNVIGTLPGEEDAPSLVLNGHVDVVEPRARGPVDPRSLGRRDRRQPFCTAGDPRT